METARALEAEDQMFEFFSFFAIAYFISSVLTPVVRRCAKVLGIMDHPDYRKVHADVQPRLGGAAIVSAFLLTLLMSTTVPHPQTSLFGVFAAPEPLKALVAHPLGQRFFVGVLIVFLLGVWDDWRGTNATIKFSWQIVAGAIVLWGQPGLGILDGLGFQGGVFPWIDLTLGIFWICLFTNALNLLDGLDGLAAGTAFFITAGFFVLSMACGSSASATILAVLAGAILGFLKYNYHPATIFMGDAGSLFLGFTLSIISLRLFNAFAARGPGMFAPAVILVLPLLDTGIAILRRWVKYSHVLRRDLPLKLLPLRQIFSPDKHHVHHRLLAIGYGHRKAVNTLYGLNALLLGCTGILAFFGPALGLWGHLAIYLLAAFFAQALVIRLGYVELIRRWAREDEDGPRGSERSQR